MRKMYSMHYINFGYSNLFMATTVDGYFPYQFVSRAKYWTNIHFRLPKRSHQLLCKDDTLSNSYPCGSSSRIILMRNLTNFYSSFLKQFSRVWTRNCVILSWPLKLVIELELWTSLKRIPRRYFSVQRLEDVPLNPI